ncbi:extracellular solute-binding protein [Ruania alkalisoli]|uniref:Extracellular solute-binding protein n=1 Tax=Ruania alkalisoli TaxID=2779775 RepID=A0A7M1SUI6_9MICO|nr:extracellular solute-binding protein [Ruania alkalisoli]QOR70594.1 extracellular solute-binding protein [Ruania alkalisoli]
MDISRRSLIVGASALSAGTLLSSCSASESGSPSGSGSAGGLGGEITVLTPAFSSGDHKAVYDAIVAEYNEIYPDVTVTTDHTDYGKLNEKLTVAVASGVIPDVIMSGMGWVEPFAAKGIYAELDASVMEGRDYPEAVLGPCQYQGSLYAVPSFLDTRCFVGNRELWDRAGISEAPTSFAEFREAAKEMTGGSGSNKQWGIIINGAGAARQLLAMAIGANGGSMFDADGTTALFTSPECVEAMQFLVDLIEDGSTSWDLKPAEGSPHPFLGGNIGMSVCPTTFWSDWSEGAPELVSEESSILFRMQNVRESIFLGGTLMSRSAQSRNAEAADAFVKHLSGVSSMQQICEIRGAVPATDEVLEQSASLQENRFIEYGVESLEFASYEGGSEAWMEIRGQLNPILEEALVGQTEVPVVMEKANAMAQEAIDRSA